MSKTALIVDDSATARTVLSRILAKYELEVTTAESAEQALDYLREGRPDVIFMDHLMPGMNGFQAVQAIKANPDTATIPIMMYTSQEGELYVGQARALGALGVLPKQVEPVEVSKVLQSLHLIPEKQAAQDSVVRPEKVHYDSVPDSELGGLLQDLFQQQRALLQEEIRDGYQQLALQRDGLEKQRGATQPAGAGLLATAVILILGLLAGWLAYLYWDAAQRWEAATARNAQLEEALAEQQWAVASPQFTVDPSLASNDLTIDTLQWAANEMAHYGFDEIPLGDSRAQKLSSLIRRLELAGFTGIVQVDSHVGRYCMTESANGSLVKAPSLTPVAECTRLGWDTPTAQALSERQTLSFANTVAGTNSNPANGITVQVAAYGSEQPLVGYPPQAEGLSAKDWNQIADLNHRVDIQLLPY